MRVSEDFYSIQGEGFSAGVPSYFIRLQNCNLMCGGEDGKLMKQGKASWWCDTEYVWKQGKEFSNEEILNKIVNSGQLKNVLKGDTHIVWTGGEVTLPRNRKDIISFLNYVSSIYIGHERLDEGLTLYNEVETNGTIKTEPIFWDYIQQINCSPKLSNSGMSREKRINSDAIEQINAHKNSWFKFVVNYEKDIEELTRDFVIPYNINKRKIILMPGVDKYENLQQTTKFVLEQAIKYGYRGSTRLHILAWDKLTGV